MAAITLEQAAQWCGGQIDPKYKDVTFSGANMDTRKLEPGQLFLALKGVRDGHDFIPAALEKGAAAVLCTHCDGDFPAIVVPDVRIALGQIARGERARLGMRVVGITGSVGKSTTKEMTASVLSGTYRVAKTPVNHNNDIGMPMAILAMPEDTQVAVLEMGMNHFREIAYLSDIAKPDLAVIVNVGTMHIENLGSVEGILQAKLEILEGLKPGGKLFAFGDNDLLWGKRNDLNDVVYFGIDNGQSAVCAADICENDGETTFCVKYSGGTFRVHLPLEGKHNVADAMAAVAVGLEMGVKPEEIAQRLSQFENMEGRQQIYQSGEYTIIKDCYNAGPESMKAALGVLGKRTGRRIAVLGDMLELGDRAPAEHYKVGRAAAEMADMVFAYGPNSQRVLSGAITGGMSQTRVSAYDDKEKLVNALRLQAQPGDVFLFKGSRGMRMETVLEQFLGADR